MNHSDISGRFALAMQACGLAGHLTVRDERRGYQTTETVGDPRLGNVIVAVTIKNVEMPTEAGK